jgi:hypothetical protein
MTPMTRRVGPIGTALRVLVALGLIYTSRCRSRPGPGIGLGAAGS